MSTQSRSAVKNRDLSTRPQFLAPATCGFVTKNQVVLGSSRFFPALTTAAIKNPLPQSENATTSSSRGNIKGPLPETKQRPFFVSASRRVRDDCITEDFLS